MLRRFGFLCSVSTNIRLGSPYLTHKQHIAGSRLVAWTYEIRTITGPNFGTYLARKNDFILEALPRAGARVSRLGFDLESFMQLGIQGHSGA